MSEKLDLFEITVKRGLEHYELPLDNTAWNNFEQALSGSGSATASTLSGGGFMTKFALAAAFLVGMVLFVNQSVQEPSNEAEGASTSTEQMSQATGDLGLEEESYIALDSTKREDVKDSSTDVLEENSSIDRTVVETAMLSEAEKARMQSINDRLQRAADNSEGSASNDSSAEGKKRHTTRYLGEDFNLGALKSFTPNGDGDNDSFLPLSLQEGDLFLMSVSKENGEVIFTSSDVSNPWEGVDRTGVELPEGRYSWEVILQKDKKKEIFKGTVKLIR